MIFWFLQGSSLQKQKPLELYFKRLFYLIRCAEVSVSKRDGVSASNRIYTIKKPPDQNGLRAFYKESKII